ncbi:hypothetical protein EBR21_03915 [bacterium]|nr:hypothetical protein [bacterium]
MSDARNKTTRQSHSTDDMLRDDELEEMLSPLRAFQPDEASLARWQSKIHLHQETRNAVTKNIRGKHPLARRGAEWLIAASIGFIISTAILGRDKFKTVEVTQTESAINSENNFDVDATELRLVAKSQ